MSLYKAAPLFPRTPITPRPSGCRGMEGCQLLPPPGTLPHPLENAPRFPQPDGLYYGDTVKGGCTNLIVVNAQN